MTTTTAVELDEVLSEGDIVMLTSSENGAVPVSLRARPLTCIEVEDGSVTFLVSNDAEWVRHLEVEPGGREVVVTRDHGGRYVALSGRAVVTTDVARAAAYWSRLSEAFFAGPDDPRIRLLDVELAAGEWWEAPTSGVGSLLAVVGTVVLGRPTPEGQHGAVV